MFSVDLRPDLIKAASARLERAGYRPTLAAADGVTGLPEHDPFDRIIATCCVQHLPPAWIEQLRPGGMLLADIKGAMAAGNLAALHRRDEPVAEGRFCAGWGGFMSMQHQLGIAAGERVNRWPATGPSASPPCPRRPCTNSTNHFRW